MKFRFELEIEKSIPPIRHQHKLLLLGSCFTENIAAKLSTYKFEVLQNPHGIIFNPVSVVDALHDYIQAKKYTEEDLFYLNEAHHSWKHHSRFSGVTVEDALQKINTSIQETHQYLNTTDYLMITLGSAWVYLLTDEKKKGLVVANNHKAPANWFEKKLMSSAEIVELFAPLINEMQVRYPAIQIIFTISPVRHLREGLVNNNRSKAALIQAVHELTAICNHVFYFPAYELVIDDLRDYRFYAEDLVHPNYFATQYVWEKFTQSCMSEETQQLIQQLDQIRLAFQHKPFNPTSQEHEKFLTHFFEKTNALKNSFPFLNLEKELEYFTKD